MEEALKKAYRAGFDASGEGYNGEYPFRDHGQSPETDTDWVAQRDKEVLEILAEQPAQQEPVAWMHEWEDGERIPMLTGRDDRNTDEPISVRPLVYADTSPPAQRTWVGLTQQEVQEIHDTYHKRMGPQEFAAMVEAKLKEKNT